METPGQGPRPRTACPKAIWKAIYGALITCISAQAGALTTSPESLEQPPTTAQSLTAPVFEVTRIRQDLTQLPLSFERNHGQTDRQVEFLSRGPGYTLFLTRTGIALSVPKPSTSHHPSGWRNPGRDDARYRASPCVLRTGEAALLQMTLAGANPRLEIQGVDRLPGQVNYLLGNDPKRWRNGIPTFTRVRYKDVYPGTDLVLYGNQHRFEYDFVLAPGADPDAIRLVFQGAENVRLDENGNLILWTPAGEIVQHAPRAYQDIDGHRRKVPAHYVLAGDNRVSFEVGAHDVERALVIDPVLIYSTYLGGSILDGASAIAVDRTGNAYLTGSTGSIDFPTANALQPARGGASFDAFVTKLSADGRAIAYSTYFGGSSDDGGLGIAVDNLGRAHVVGSTRSTDFPTRGALQPALAGIDDAFVARLSAAGTALVYSTYLGGGNPDTGFGIAVDEAGNAYVTGGTASADFPTRNALQAVRRGTDDAFVAKLNAAGSRLLYSTYLGGRGADAGFGIAVDEAGNAYLTGTTRSFDFPTRNALQPALGGGDDAFIAKLNATGSGLAYATYLGGQRLEVGRDIAVDREGRAYLTGTTRSFDFPTRHALQPALGGGDDAFIAKLNATGSALAYATYLGGRRSDFGTGIVVDRVGKVHVTGITSSSDFPVRNAHQPALAGSFDAFVAKLDARSSAGSSALVYSTYLGGRSLEIESAIAVDSVGNVYLAGETESTDFPTVRALQPTLGGFRDAFVSKLLATDRVNRLVSFRPLPATLTTTPNATGCPANSVAQLRFLARLENLSDAVLREGRVLSNVHVGVTELPDGSVLLTEEGRVGRQGAFSIPEREDYRDGKLSPGESVDVPFTVCLESRSPVRLRVEVLAGVAGAP